jgi:phage protein U
MSWGSAYSKSWFGNANEDSTIGWGVLYPVVAGGSSLLASIISIFSDSTRTTTDQTEI